MPDEDITPDSLPNLGGEGTVGVNSEDHSGSSVQPTEGQAEAMTLAELNQSLGKNFTSKDAAIKALKDTFSYVGKKTEPDDALLKAKGYMTKDEFENELFFRDNPSHTSNKKILESIAKADGITLAKAAETPEYKKLFEGALEYEKVQSLKTVLNPNPRLQQAVEKSQTVADLSKQGRRDDAGVEAARAVIEAYGLDK
jgi:hypothetical protein